MKTSKPREHLSRKRQRAIDRAIVHLEQISRLNRQSIAPREAGFRRDQVAAW